MKDNNCRNERLEKAELMSRRAIKIVCVCALDWSNII